MSKLFETVQPNVVNAPILFVGCGGKGSQIIRGVADRALHDDNSMLRFVCMDTDVNDILNVDKGANVRAVQTSSTATIETYLKNDKIAKEYWFPENKMLDPKPVSEGAGQVRAISRLALNATIKEGKIVELYNAIDELFLKDGGKFKQAIKVTIASTAAGGTGSGIAMEVGMLIRHYINKNYPEAAVMIRGFFVMPGVMDTVIKTQSERDSIRANGYATIKEINAFMMKGSGFFDTVPELRRYKDLHISIPNATSGEEKLSCLPFDFCFLMDRTDSNSGNMITLDQYVDFASQAIYEQTIGPMNKASNSKEDNILKLCIRPETLGRCRFAGMGASKLIYPYDKIKKYISLNWTRAAIIGSSADKNLKDSEKEKLLKNSWLQYDVQFRQELMEYNENPSAGGEAPKIEKSYVNAMKQGKDESAGNNFTSGLWKKYLTPKVMNLFKQRGEVKREGGQKIKTILDYIKPDSSTQDVAKSYLATMINQVIDSLLVSSFPDFQTNRAIAQIPCSEEGNSHKDKYEAVESLEMMSKDDRVAEIATVFAKGVFSSKSPINKSGLGDYMLEKFISVDGNAMHPNAIRFMLYELYDVLKKCDKIFVKDMNSDDYESMLEVLKFGEGGNTGIDKFQVGGLKALGKENNLYEMCDACDKKGAYRGSDEGDNCEKFLTGYFQNVQKFYISVIGHNICQVAKPKVSALIEAYQDFFNSFDSKVPDIEKKQEDIVTSLEFKNGDYVYNLFNNEQYLSHLSSAIDRPADTGEATNKLYAKIFESVRNNSYLNERRGINPFNYEAPEDIFDDVIVKYYEDMVENNAHAINVQNVLQAIKLEFNIKNSLEVSQVNESMKEKKQRDLATPENLRKYIQSLINKCENLASPGIKKNTQDEAREVRAIACSASMEDGAGIRINDYLDTATKTDTVSAYELHFFRSVYNITPTQLSKLAAPSSDEIEDQFALSSEGELDLPSTGDYFRIYQKYMDTIGPDSRSSAVITPHIDQRWNAISVMPELDMDYQRKLMSKIHKSLIYGFVYDRIKMRKISDENPNQKVYAYLDNEEIKQEMIVSNGTRCDELYEVLDSLYYDRKAVSTIRDFVNDVRVKIREKGCKNIDESDFFNYLSKLTRKKVLNLPDDYKDETISLFEIVLMYCNSLPAQDKDESEMRIMINSIIEILQAEIASFTNNEDTIMSRTADVLFEQYCLFVENFKKNKEILRVGLFSEDIVETAQSSIIRYLKEKDLLSYVDKVRDISIN